MSDDWTQWDPAWGKREEFRALAQTSGRVRNLRGDAQLEGAENLLVKAVRRLSAGEAERARPLVERAAAMPWDAHEEHFPGVRAALMLVYREINDRFEAEYLGEDGWLDVPLAVLPRLGAQAAAEVASVLHGYVLQDYDLSRRETRRIVEATGDAPLEAGIGSDAGLGVPERVAIIDDLLDGVVALQEAYAAAEA